MNTIERLGRFNHHPDPAIDFCIEVESLQGRLRSARLGIAKPGEAPECISCIKADIQRALEFTTGGDPNAIDAKWLLRELEREAAAHE